MNASSETSVGNVTLAASTGAGLIAAINEYAVVISLSLTLLGILIGVFFHVLAVKDRRRGFRIREQESELKEKELKLKEQDSQP